MPTFFKTEVVPYTNGLQRLTRQVDRFGSDEFTQYFDGELKALRQGIRNFLRNSPIHDVSPIFWEPSKRPEDAGKKPNTEYGFYSRQKTAYFLSGGFGKGIPSPHSGGVLKAWDVRTRRVKRGMILEVKNTHPAFEFVYGERQQTQFALMGYQPIEVLLRDIQAFTDETIDISIEVAMEKFFGFKG